MTHTPFSSQHVASPGAVNNALVRSFVDIPHIDSYLFMILTFLFFRSLCSFFRFFRFFLSFVRFFLSLSFSFVSFVSFFSLVISLCCFCSAGDSVTLWYNSFCTGGANVTGGIPDGACGTLPSPHASESLYLSCNSDNTFEIKYYTTAKCSGTDRETKKRN